MGVSIDLNMLMKEMFNMILVLSLACTLLHMTITLCNFQLCQIECEKHRGQWTLLF